MAVYLKLKVISCKRYDMERSKFSCFWKRWTIISKHSINKYSTRKGRRFLNADWTNPSCLHFSWVSPIFFLNIPKFLSYLAKIFSIFSIKYYEGTWPEFSPSSRKALWDRHVSAREQTQPRAGRPSTKELASQILSDY